MSRTNTNTFAQLTADGNTAAFSLPGDVCDIDVYIADAETWGGGTLKMQTSFDGGTTWVDVPNASWTSGDGLLSAGVRAYGRDVRFNLAGATSPVIDVTIKAVAVSQASVEVYGPLTDNGNTVVLAPRGGAVAVFVKGTWDSGSLTLSHSPDGTLYVDSGMTAITANGGGFFTNTCGDTLLRLVLASVAAASADLDVWVYSVPA